jgi:hypothetical protein
MNNSNIGVVAVAVGCVNWLKTQKSGTHKELNIYDLQ